MTKKMKRIRKSWEKLNLIDQRDEINRDKLVATGEHYYLKHWWTITHISYNKRDTLRLARALQVVKPELTLYQAKLFMSQINWYDYSYFFDLLLFLDNRYQNKFNELLTYLDCGGKTFYERENTQEYEKQLDDYWKEKMASAVKRSDGSVIVEYDLELEDKYPLLKKSKEDYQHSKEEMATELDELTTLMVSLVKKHQYKDMIFLYLNSWQHRYSLCSDHVRAHEVGRQISQAKMDLTVENWLALKEDFKNVLGWWN